MEIINWSALNEKERNATLMRPAQESQAQVEAVVKEIIDNVRTKGDEALLAYTQKFDKCPREQLKLSEEEIASACQRLEGSELKEAIDEAYDNIYAFHSAQKAAHISIETTPGIICQTATHPIESVGLYVPGGTAPLVSTALMLGVPAQVAQCEKVALCSPYPMSDAIIYAANKCQIKDIFCMGGAHAIAAFAYGTESIAKVNKIFGPGNQYVTTAKRLVSDDANGAAIDMPAGPSEVLVIADKHANSAFVAADLLSQAEHGIDSQVILLSDSEQLIKSVQEDLEQQLALLPRKDIAKAALEKSHLILCSSLDEAIAISNRYAPEHLIVQTQNANEICPRLKNAGSIFLGAYTCESLGDYASGTNHTLPTYGYAKTASALGTDDFRRRYTISTATAQGLSKIAKTVEVLAKAENLFAHGNAVTLRLKERERVLNMFNGMNL